jgi:hypothetical protein
MGSAITGGGPTPSPRKESMIHRRDWAVRETNASRGPEGIAEKRSLGHIDQEMTPSPLQLGPGGSGDSRPIRPHLTEEGFNTTPSSSTYSHTHFTGKISDPRIAYWRPGRGQIPKGVMEIEAATPTSPSGGDSVIHPSQIHPLLRQSQSVGSETHATPIPRDTADVKVPPRTSIPTGGFGPMLNHPLKVADLRERYDRKSSSTPLLPLRRKDDPSRPQLASPTASLVALSAAIGLATFPGSSKTPSSTETPTSLTDKPDTTPDTLSPEERPPNAKKKSHPSPLKDNITIFESLGRPAATLAKAATSSRAAATVRRRGGDVTHNLKKRIASNGTQMWRRLSGSLDKEVDESLPPLSGEGAGGGGGPPTRKKRVESKGGGVAPSKPRGFEPGRNTHPSARESTFFVQGTISRVPRGFASRQQQQKTRASDARRSDAPSLPDLDFEVDGAADMLGYFEQEFDIHFQITGRQKRDTTDHSGGTGGGSDESASSTRPIYRNPHPNVVNKSRASPVLSIRSAQAARPEIPPRNPERMRRRPPTPAPARNRDGGFCDNRPPVKPMVSVAEDNGDVDGDAEEEMVVSSAQCGLAHPRPSRVLDVRRFVGYCRETARARGKL